MRNIEVSALDMNRMAELIGDERAAALKAEAAAAEEAIGDATIWNVNATAAGGGVAEMLQVLLAYARGFGVDTQWLVLNGEPTFFATTKRIHNLVHGMPGDGGPLGEAERLNYEEVLGRNLRQQSANGFEEGDLFLLHDPQTAGLIPELKKRGFPVVWRSHIGRDESNECTTMAWDFLNPYIQQADKIIVSREAYIPPDTPPEKVLIIPPSIDPFAAKNADLEPDEIHRTLVRCGLMEGEDDGLPVTFTRRNGEQGEMAPHLQAILVGDKLQPETPLVLQVSRWDRLKDMEGVMTGFLGNSDIPEEAHLVLCGPDVSGVSDDPEGAHVLMECTQAFERLPKEQQARVHLVCLPMEDVSSNAHMVDALQRHATVVVQKSLFEGFGLTVTEAMWKSKPMVASRIGGIQDQIRHEQEGLLIDDPADLDSFGRAVAWLLNNPEEAARMGAAAHDRVLDQYLGDRHLRQYGTLFAELIAGAK